jgi:hypothetical protein
MIKSSEQGGGRMGILDQMSGGGVLPEAEIYILTMVKMTPIGVVEC